MARKHLGWYSQGPAGPQPSSGPRRTARPEYPTQGPAPCWASFLSCRHSKRQACLACRFIPLKRFERARRGSSDGESSTRSRRPSLVVDAAGLVHYAQPFRPSSFFGGSAGPRIVGPSAERNSCPMNTPLFFPSSSRVLATGGAVAENGVHAFFAAHRQPLLVRCASRRRRQ